MLILYLELALDFIAFIAKNLCILCHTLKRLIDRWIYSETMKYDKTRNIKPIINLTYHVTSVFLLLMPERLFIQRILFGER